MILDGKKLAGEIRERVKQDVTNLNKIGIDVGLALLLAGDNQSSVKYFMATLKASEHVGINVFEYKLPSSASQNEILNVIRDVNADERISGLLVLFPLPGRINARGVVNSILPEKDVDGLGSVSVGRLAAEESMFQIFSMDASVPLEGRPYVHHRSGFIPCMPSSFLPCTPYGVIMLLENYGVEFGGKNVVVIGKSLAVGKPLAMMFLAKEATVSICHKSTQNLEAYLRNADIVCSATGVPGLIKGNMIKEGAIVVDIGINVRADGSIVGDVDFATVSEKASMITPVPGGVGPVTIAILLQNTVRSAQSNVILNHPLTIP
ncbi:MAG: bifunctional 5,10-methylenetetrahydrofolate dehydrogenase/5,10-methenyltetrahydrofolate cyclohydrolase [Nitrospirae bacterium]|nr:bifunctional 5,10-methylenetetrahydrofolate dehydrogenase/5,10-methenyltetrahydrofolate cyclohydrolase [Nitrospirota bacterium]